MLLTLPGTNCTALISLFLGLSDVSIAINAICGQKLSCPLFIPISHTDRLNFKFNSKDPVNIFLFIKTVFPSCRKKKKNKKKP